MKQLKALFKKEWHTNRFTLLLPVYATLFIYLAVGIAVIVAWSQGVKPTMVMRDVETGTGAKTMGLFIMVFGTATPATNAKSSIPRNRCPSPCSAAASSPS